MKVLTSYVSCPNKVISIYLTRLYFKFGHEMFINKNKNHSFLDNICLKTYILPKTSIARTKIIRNFSCLLFL